jgi:hypothetical protein
MTAGIRRLAAATGIAAEPSARPGLASTLFVPI